MITRKFLLPSLALILAILGMGIMSQVSANPADVDPGFDTGIPIGFNADIKSIARQSDGKLIIGGQFTTYKGIPANYIVRLNQDGSKDSSFAIGDGFENSVYSVAIQADGKIIVGGYFNGYQGISANKIIRLNSDGSRDTSFDMGDGFNYLVTTIAVQDDGKIIIGGGFASYKGVPANTIIRLNSDGSRDTSFDMGNGFNGAVTALKIQSDGKIIVGGTFTSYKGLGANRIIRLNSLGAKDTSFVIGSGFENGVTTITIQSDGKIIVGGAFTSYKGITTNKIIRLLSTGAKDTSFVIGSGFNNTINAIAVQSDGQIIVGGTFTSYKSIATNTVVRLSSTGTKDISFATGNELNNQNYNETTALYVQSDGKIIVGKFYGGYGDSLRINPDGSKDSSFTNGDGFDLFVQSLATQSDGKILVGGAFTMYRGLSANKIIRLNADGLRDSSFLMGDGFNGTVTALTIQSDGKIIVGGEFTSYDGTTANYIIRINTDGSRDTSFLMGNGFDSSIHSIAIQSDGKIIIVGEFTTYQGVSANKIIRLNQDGSRDTSFLMGDGFGEGVYSIAIQSDGKIIVGGEFTTYQGVSTNRIIRLNQDGSRDTSFLMGDGFNGAVTALKTQSDGKIIVGGSFTTYQGSIANSIIRINTDGSRDISFTQGILLDSSITSLAIQSDGKIVVGGVITRFNIDGTKDTSFNPGIGVNYIVYVVDIKESGEIFIGGDFSNYNGLAAGHLTSLYGDSSMVILPNSTNTGTVTTEFTSKGYTQSNGDLVGSTAISLSATDGNIPSALSIVNEDITLSIPADTQFKQADNITNYSGVISAPIVKSIASVNDETVATAFKVGSSTESIKLVGGLATLLVPVPGETIGDMIQIYYSEDNGVTWYPQVTTLVIEHNGQPYVEFTTNHFTDFAVTILAGTFTGSFVINNDAASTTSSGVTLHLSTTPPVAKMRFSNDGITRPAWENYASTKSRTLPGTYGDKTVYAQFDADGDGTDDITTSDEISYISEGGGAGAGSSGGSNTGNLRLQITTTSGTCTYGTSLFIGSHASQFAAYDMTGTNFSSSFSCIDTEGLSGWTMTMQASTDLSNGSQSIPKANVSLLASTNYLANGSCSTGTNQIDWAEIGTNPGTIINKMGNHGDICTLTTDTVNLAVHIPAAQAVGLYTGTLMLNMPF